MPADSSTRRHVFYSGHVQGVGFRFTTRSLAARFEVGGWVKNLPDGRVEMVVEGTAQELDRFQRAIAEALEGKIDHVETLNSPAQGEFDQFVIRH